MSRSKAAVLALLCMCLPFLNAQAQSDSLIPQDMIRNEAVRYARTAVVENGVFERSYSTSATEYYPHTYMLGVEVNNASFEKYHVTRKQEVRAGDVLASFTLDIDEEALRSTQLALERTQREYEDGCKQRMEEIDRLLEQRLSIEEAYERELAGLRIERAMTAYEQYCYQQECTIAELRQKLETLQEENSRTQLLSPVDGIVSDLTYKRAGERVYAHETLVTIYREDGMLLSISNSSLNFRYGMPVTVTSGMKANQVTYQGSVVAADDLLPENRRQGYALIRLEPEAKPKYKQINVSGVSQYLEDVLVIPRRAAAMDGGKYYVECLVDGNPQKRCVNVGLAGATDMWIVQGLQTGDVVIAD